MANKSHPKNRSRRQHKKLRVDEFAEFGFKVEIRLKDGSYTDQALDKWLEFVEGNGMSYGGGSPPGQIRGFVTRKGGGTLTEDHRKLVDGWLDAQSDIEQCEISPLLDAHYPERWPERWQ